MRDPKRGIEMPARTRRFMQELAGSDFDSGAREHARPTDDAPPERTTTASGPAVPRVRVALMVVACAVVLLVGLAWQLAP
jgi:hypothetical protein